MPKSLQEQCIDLVKIYSKELVELLLKDISPQEVCASLKLCDPAKNIDNESESHVEKQIVAVPRNDLEGKQACALCEYALHCIQQAITNPRAEVNYHFHFL